jgi:SLT domain-containing protein
VERAGVDLGRRFRRRRRSGSLDVFLLHERERTERGRKVTNASLESIGMNKNFRSEAYGSLEVW